MVSPALMRLHAGWSGRLGGPAREGQVCSRSSNTAHASPHRRRVQPRAARPGYSGQQLAQPQQEARSSDQQQWASHYQSFAEADRLEEAARRLRLRASRLRKTGQANSQAALAVAAQQRQLEQQDPLAQALAAMERSADEQRFDDAARLRDQSLAWVEGWWRVTGGHSERVAAASLLHVGKASGRWEAHLFTTGDLIQFDQQRPGSTADGGSTAPVRMASLLADRRFGTPLFEAFIVPSAEGGGDGDGDGGSASGFAAVVAALPSAQRALNELLHVKQQQQQQAGQPGQPRPVNQRFMLMLQPGGAATLAAVHAGNDSSLWVWSLGGDAAAPAAAGRGPVRPAECGTGVYRTTFSFDFNEIDLLRGPGEVQRTGSDSFSFRRRRLTPDVPLAMCGSGGSDARPRMFRVDLQYSLPPPAANVAAAGPGEASSSSSSGASSGSSPPAWAGRIAREVAQAGGDLAPGGEAALAALLAAAAAGTAPAGPAGDAAVSEAQQPVRVAEVPLPGQEVELEEPLHEASFARITEKLVTLSFGGWDVPVRL